MSCNCTNYDCVTVVPDFSECPDTIELNLKASETATYVYLVEFNSNWYGGSVDVVDGENIVLPNSLNENYSHTIKFLDNQWNVINDTCYILDTSQIPMAMSVITNTGYVFTIEVDADGVSFSNSLINNRDVQGLLTENQSYNNAQFTRSTNTITLTNGDSLYQGQKVTVIIKH